MFVARRFGQSLVGREDASPRSSTDAEEMFSCCCCGDRGFSHHGFALKSHSELPQAVEHLARVIVVNCPLDHIACFTCDLTKHASLVVLMREFRVLVSLSQSHVVNCPSRCAEGRESLLHPGATSHHLIFLARPAWKISTTFAPPTCVSSCIPDISCHRFPRRLIVAL